MSTALPSREADTGMRPLQSFLPGLCPVSAAVESLSDAEGIEARGAIFTRREVVDFLLDLTGYVAQSDLCERRLLEPSFGQGDFLLPAIDRLLSSWARTPRNEDPIVSLGDCIRAVELHRATFAATRTAVIERISAAGLSPTQASTIADRWLINADFLLVDLPEGFDTVVGNPPYVRQELIPDVLLTEYRARYQTIFDRADIYVPFIERSLRLLGPGGNLGFICADRWMKNRYGGPLRQFVSDSFHLRVYVDMTGADAFQSEVVAYPAITVIGRGSSGATRIASQSRIDADALKALSSQLLAPELQAKGFVQQLDGVTAGSAPWILDASGKLGIVRRLEAALPTLEEAGCRVGIGVATGADKAFIGPYDELDVEDDRKLPLAMTRDIDGGTVKWRGFGVVNPFASDGGLVRLDDYPRLKRYLEARRELIAGRHVARKAPANWYRTIDRITPDIASAPKLLIPDIKGDAHIVYEKGELYPHHNLYYITSRHWDLHALQAVLLSTVTRVFIAAYSTKMRGGYLRFQAQYLRRLRLPAWDTVPRALQSALAKAAEARDIEACDHAAFKLYGLSPGDVATLRRKEG